MIQLFLTRPIRRVVVLAATLAVVACTAVPSSPTTGITRERAIEIARSSVSFDPTSVDAQLARAVWVVTFRRADGSHGGFGQFAQVTIERSTGNVIRIAMS